MPAASRGPNGAGGRLLSVTKDFRRVREFREILSYAHGLIDGHNGFLVTIYLRG